MLIFQKQDSLAKRFLIFNLFTILLQTFYLIGIGFDGSTQSFPYTLLRTEALKTNKQTKTCNLHIHLANLKKKYKLD